MKMNSSVLTLSFSLFLTLSSSHVSYGQSAVQPKHPTAQSKQTTAPTGKSSSSAVTNAKSTKQSKTKSAVVAHTTGAAAAATVTTTSQRTALWNRYFQAGELAAKKQDQDLEKRYFAGALSALEQQTSGPRPRSLGRLERGLMAGYPVDWSQVGGSDETKAKKQQEQVDLLARLSRLNEKFPDKHASSGLNKYVQSKYLAAQSDLQKTKDKIKEKADAKASSSSDGSKPPASSSETGSNSGTTPSTTGSTPTK